MILGTAAYMAPEQARGKPVDKRATSGPLACVLYEMLTGRRAFEGEDVSDVLRAVIEPDPAWTALPALPPLIRLVPQAVSQEEPETTSRSHPGHAAGAGGRLRDDGSWDSRSGPSAAPPLEARRACRGRSGRRGRDGRRRRMDAQATCTGVAGDALRACARRGSAVRGDQQPVPGRLPGRHAARIRGQHPVIPAVAVGTRGETHSGHTRGAGGAGTPRCFHQTASPSPSIQAMRSRRSPSAAERRSRSARPS